MKTITLALNMGTTKADINVMAAAIAKAVQVTNPITRYALLRAFQAAAEEACKQVTEDAICEALREQNGKPIYPGAAAGKDFLVEGNTIRVTIKNEFPYGEQVIKDADGSLVDDPNSAAWRAETAKVLARKEQNKTSTKTIAGIEAAIRQEHPRMKPTDTTVSIALRNK